MRLLAWKANSHEHIGLVMDDLVIPLSLLCEIAEMTFSEDMLTLLQTGQFHELKQFAERVSRSVALKTKCLEEALPVGALLTKAELMPLYRRPRKIWGIGLNYVEHAGDLKAVLPTEEPASFMKADTTLIGPGDVIKLPEQSLRVTAEAEIAIVIGKECRNISAEEAPDYVAGFVSVIDMTAEDILQKNPRFLTRAKNFDTFFSLGGELLTVDELPNLPEVKVATYKNGELHRENVVANMTFDPWYLVAFHSQVMTLLPGDIISTGTPGAVVIRDGDMAESRIEGFLPLVNPVRNAR